MASKVVEIEGGRRFSASALWDWQADYFRRAGIAAWAGALPFYATSNPFIADRYAQVIHRYLLELGRLDATVAGQPVQIVELGAGPGQFAFYCASRLAELCQATLPAVRPVYVLTDLAPAMVDFWAAQPALARLAAEGWVDFATFDVDRPAPLAPREDRKPAAVVCIANYVLDSTRADAFRVEPGRLLELRPSLRVGAGKLLPGRPPRLADVDVRFVPAAADPAGYYGAPAWNRVLADYAGAGRGGFVFPTATLAALDVLRGMAGGRLLLLAADKGYGADEVAGRGAPVLTRHGSAFSIEVNFDAVARVVAQDGGVAVQQANADGLFTGAYLWRRAGEAMPETVAAADAALRGFGPYDFMSLYRALRQAPAVDARTLLALLRLSRWDPHVLSRLAPKILDGDALRHASFRRALRAGLTRAEALIYRKPGMLDYDFDLARLAYGLKDFEGALRLYGQSIAHAGDSAAARLNRAHCLAQLRRDADVAAELRCCLALDPRNAEAADWLARL